MNSFFNCIANPTCLFAVKTMINHWANAVEIPVGPVLPNNAAGNFGCWKNGSGYGFFVFMCYFSQTIYDIINTFISKFPPRRTLIRKFKVERINTGFFLICFSAGFAVTKIVFWEFFCLIDLIIFPQINGQNYIAKPDIIQVNTINVILFNYRFCLFFQVFLNFRFRRAKPPVIIYIGRVCCTRFAIAANRVPVRMVFEQLFFAAVHCPHPAVGFQTSTFCSFKMPFAVAFKKHSSDSCSIKTPVLFLHHFIGFLLVWIFPNPMFQCLWFVVFSNCFSN